MKSRWIMGVVLSSCLLLASCNDNKAPIETQRIAGVQNTTEVAESSAAPKTVPMAAPSNEAKITFELTMKAANEKADLVIANP